mmetsp:Transcript_29066/g.66857  ORF Transcript_29066/g.66857 Transcript_29066/m.66857 type:complete len:109 (+) Transcript_29066:2428-2754(+)
MASNPTVSLMRVSGMVNTWQNAMMGFLESGLETSSTCGNAISVRGSKTSGRTKRAHDRKTMHPMTVATPGTANTMSEYASMLESLVMAAQAARSLPLQVSERCRAKMA